MPDEDAIANARPYTYGERKANLARLKKDLSDAGFVRNVLSSTRTGAGPFLTQLILTVIASNILLALSRYVSNLNLMEYVFRYGDQLRKLITSQPEEAPVQTPEGATAFLTTQLKQFFTDVSKSIGLPSGDKALLSPPQVSVAPPSSSIEGSAQTVLTTILSTMVPKLIEIWSRGKNEQQNSIDIHRFLMNQTRDYVKTLSAQHQEAIEHIDNQIAAELSGAMTNLKLAIALIEHRELVLLSAPTRRIRLGNLKGAPNQREDDSDSETESVNGLDLSDDEEKVKPDWLDGEALTKEELMLGDNLTKAFAKIPPKYDGSNVEDIDSLLFQIRLASVKDAPDRPQVLFLGAPGTGKTMLAKEIEAAAKSANVNLPVLYIKYKDIGAHGTAAFYAFTDKVKDMYVQSGVRNPIIVIDEGAELLLKFPEQMKELLDQGNTTLSLSMDMSGPSVQLKPFEIDNFNAATLIFTGNQQVDAFDTAFPNERLIYLKSVPLNKEKRKPVLDEVQRKPLKELSQFLIHGTDHQKNKETVKNIKRLVEQFHDVILDKDVETYQGVRVLKRIGVHFIDGLLNDAFKGSDLKGEAGEKLARDHIDRLYNVSKKEGWEKVQEADAPPLTFGHEMLTMPGQRFPIGTLHAPPMGQHTISAANSSYGGMPLEASYIEHHDEREEEPKASIAASKSKKAAERKLDFYLAERRAKSLGAKLVNATTTPKTNTQIKGDMQQILAEDNANISLAFTTLRCNLILDAIIEEKKLRDRKLIIDAHGASNVADVVSFLKRADKVPTIDSISVNVSDCDIDNDIAEELGKLKKLVSLTALNNRLTIDGVVRLKDSSSLKSVEIIGNRLTATEIKLIEAASGGIIMAGSLGESIGLGHEEYIGTAAYSPAAPPKLEIPKLLHEGLGVSVDIISPTANTRGRENGLFPEEIDKLDNQYGKVGSSRVDLQACKLEYSIVSPK